MEPPSSEDESSAAAVQANKETLTHNDNEDQLFKWQKETGACLQAKLEAKYVKKGWKIHM